MSPMRAFITPVLALGSLLAALAYGIVTWLRLGESQISLLGWIALTLGAVLTLALGGGLMALSFYSARRGHDDAHHRQGFLREPPPDE